MISIGPYHHGKENLKKMEKYKLEYLQGILERRREESAEKYIASLRGLEAEARDCYAEPIIMSSQDFLQMMLLDGCFIIELMQKTQKIVDTSEDDLIFTIEWYRSVLCRDLLLFENQLPFFILELLFDMTKIENHPEDLLILLSIDCLKGFFAAEPPYEFNKPRNKKNIYVFNKLRNKTFHLLRLMHECWVFSFSNPSLCQSICIEMEKTLYSRGDQQQVQDTQQESGRQRRKEQEVKYPDNMEFIKTVCELKEYGIEFEKVKKSRSCLDVKFENGIMKIPTLMVDDRPESILRNLIAYEQYITLIAGSSTRVVTDYTTFIDCLINSSKDVQMLCDKEIITNWLGSNEELSNMINKIGSYVCVTEEFSYKQLFKDVNKHCRRRRHRWIAELKTKYFTIHGPSSRFWLPLSCFCLLWCKLYFPFLSTFKKVVCLCDIYNFVP